MERREIVERYLDALDVPAGAPDLELMTSLVRAHVSTFAFSSIGPRLQEDLPLNLDRLYERIVVNRRGGYCFEQNGLMLEVLQELGFDVDVKLARVIYGRDYLPGLTHRVTLATVEGVDYVVDVGFGPHGPPFPVPLREEPAEGAPWTHRVHQRDENEFHMQLNTDDGPLSLYRFDLGPYGPYDCEIGHFYSHRHPEAVFVNNLVASRILDEEIRSLRNSTYVVLRPGGDEKTVIADAAHLRTLLADEVGVLVTEAEAERLFADLPDTDEITGT